MYQVKANKPGECQDYIPMDYVITRWFLGHQNRSHTLHLLHWPLHISTVTPFTLAHLLCIHLPHCTHRTELAFTLKLKSLHESTLLLDNPSCVIPPLTITFVFDKGNFQILTLKWLLLFYELILDCLTHLD